MGDGNGGNGDSHLNAVLSLWRVMEETGRAVAKQGEQIMTQVHEGARRDERVVALDVRAQDMEVRVRRLEEDFEFRRKARDQEAKDKREAHLFWRRQFWLVVVLGPALSALILTLLLWLFGFHPR